jgi:[acyl-carrier-protein] S-malonyltransferase
MGRALSEQFPVARQVFEEVDDALGEGLSRLMAEGPGEDLMLTRNTQPALMAASMAVVRVIEHETGSSLATYGAFVAGHSLGEYSALCAVGALPLTETAQLLRLRGEAMQRAVAVGEGAMAALLGVGLEIARAVAADAAQGEVCAAANDNAPGQVVLSGSRGAIERAIELAGERGAKRAIMLPVSAPFHCALMAPAGEAMAEALAETTIAPPALPLIANVTACPVTEPAIIRRLLVEQVTTMVRWRESVHYLRSQEVESVVELGHGKVLSGLVKRIDRDLAPSSIGDGEALEAFLGTL